MEVIWRQFDSLFVDRMGHPKCRLFVHSYNLIFCAVRPSRAEAKSIMKAYAFGRASVLLVDDSMWMRRILRNMLKSLGFSQIYEAANGTAALATIEAARPDVILTDWDMHPMSGLELTQCIRRLPSEVRYTPIIMISAHGRLSNVLAARNAGVTEFLVKPMSPQALHHRLVAVIERPRAFIEAPEYIGPDRRRRTEGTDNPGRRQSDRETAPPSVATRGREDRQLNQSEISDIMSCARTPEEVCG